MIFLIVTLCTSASMTDCEVYRFGQYKTPQACETAVGIYRQVLEPAENYRLECVQQEPKE